jgi:nicotinate-nucleotide pyrophosphorylase (carboxylating)
VTVREAAVLAAATGSTAACIALDAARIAWQSTKAPTCGRHAGLRDRGRRRALLSAERPALNFLQLLSATATRHARPRARHRRRVAEPARLRRARHAQDPAGLRQAQKYAVRVGGGQNQRLALWHGILIKENHIAAAGGVAAALANAFALQSGVEIQIEVETLAQLHEALAAGADQRAARQLHRAGMREAVAVTAGRALLEVSGGVTLAQLRGIAATGVDRISIGKLTKDVQAVDYSMRVTGRAGR